MNEQKVRAIRKVLGRKLTKEEKRIEQGKKKLPLKVLIKQYDNR